MARENSRPGKQHRPRHSRYPMNRILRRLLVSLLTVLMAVILLAGYIALFPLVFNYDTPVLNYHRNSQVKYDVKLRPNNFTDQNTLGMDQIYLKDFTEAINARFDYEFIADRAGTLQYAYRADATLRVHDAANPANILLTRQMNLLPETSGQVDGSSLKLGADVQLKPADYDSMISEFAATAALAVTYDLAVVFSVSITTALPAGSFHLNDTPSLIIPLNQAQFQLTRQLPDTQPATVVQPLRYQLVMSQVPFPVYPATAAVCFLLIVFILTTNSAA